MHTVDPLVVASLQVAALSWPSFPHVSSAGDGEAGGFTEGAARGHRETEVRQCSFMLAMLSYVHTVCTCVCTYL